VTEFVRGLVLPDLVPPSPEDLLSLLLVWDELEVSTPNIDNEFRAELRESGLVREYPYPLTFEVVVDPDLPDEPTGEEITSLAADDGKQIASAVRSIVSGALERADEQGLAPLATTSLAQLASALPPPAPLAPVVEATLIQIATRGIRVQPGTTLDEVLAFRERNKALMGRFRGAMIDLAAAIEADKPAKTMEQAYAILVNRIEPVLGDLASNLERNRVSFAIATVLGATSVSLATLDPAGQAVAGGHVLSRSLRYAFDRERLVREHPLGLVHRAQEQFAGPQAKANAGAITDPESLLEERCVAAALGLRKYLHDLVEDEPPHQ